MEGVSRDTATQIAATLSQDAKETEPLQILDTLKPVLELTLDCLSHVRVAALGFGGAVVMGFDWPIFDQVARWKGIEIDAEMFADLRVLEQEMIALVNTPRKGEPA